MLSDLLYQAPCQVEPVNPGKSGDKNPKPHDLGVGRLKPYESEVEGRTGDVLQNSWMTCVKKQKANLVRKYLGPREMYLSTASR